MRKFLFFLAFMSCVSYARWTATGHVAELPCGGDVGVRPADLSTDDEVDDWGVTAQVRTPILEPCVPTGSAEGGE